MALEECVMEITKSQDASSSNAERDAISGFTADEVQFFQTNGYFIARQFADRDWIARMRLVTKEHLDRELSPIEFEAEVHYPGSPPSLDSLGGRTVRRLLQAHSRDIVFTEWVMNPEIIKRLQQLLGGRVAMPLAHHNCVMTKQPEFSSETGWHQDVRYWSFSRSDLVSVWLALGSERPENGCLWVIPGSHRMALEPFRFDKSVFFRTDIEENQPLLATKVPVVLEPGDVLFFHARTLHSASRNTTKTAKFSVVFTFRRNDNLPIPDSRSALGGELLLPEV
jgi:phytanoyl-CoA hydroxylase